MELHQLHGAAAQLSAAGRLPLARRSAPAQDGARVVVSWSWLRGAEITVGALMQDAVGPHMSRSLARLLEVNQTPFG